jgi:glycosyltransferase involved in cell wall biosynthesis
VIYKGVLHPNVIEKTTQQYNLMFLPTRGENFGHVIIESLISGIPVLISDQTPWNHIKEIGVGFVESLTNQGAFVEVINRLGKEDQKWMNEINEACFLFSKKYTQDPAAIALNKNLFLPHE